MERRRSRHRRRRTRDSGSRRSRHSHQPSADEFDMTFDAVDDVPSDDFVRAPLSLPVSSSDAFREPELSPRYQNRRPGRAPPITSSADFEAQLEALASGTAVVPPSNEMMMEAEAEGRASPPIQQLETYQDFFDHTMTTHGEENDDDVDPLADFDPSTLGRAGVGAGHPPSTSSSSHPRGRSSMDRELDAMLGISSPVVLSSSFEHGGVGDGNGAIGGNGVTTAATAAAATTTADDPMMMFLTVDDFEVSDDDTIGHAGGGGGVTTTSGLLLSPAETALEGIRDGLRNVSIASPPAAPVPLPPSLPPRAPEPSTTSQSFDDAVPDPFALLDDELQMGLGLGLGDDNYYDDVDDDDDPFLGASVEDEGECELVRRTANPHETMIMGMDIVEGTTTTTTTTTTTRGGIGVGGRIDDMSGSSSLDRSESFRAIRAEIEMGRRLGLGDSFGDDPTTDEEQREQQQREQQQETAAPPPPPVPTTRTDLTHDGVDGLMDLNEFGFGMGFAYDDLGMDGGAEAEATTIAESIDEEIDAAPVAVAGEEEYEEETETDQQRQQQQQRREEEFEGEEEPLSLLGSLEQQEDAAAFESEYVRSEYAFDEVGEVLEMEMAKVGATATVGDNLPQPQQQQQQQSDSILQQFADEFVDDDDFEEIGGGMGMGEWENMTVDDFLPLTEVTTKKEEQTEPSTTTITTTPPPDADTAVVVPESQPPLFQKKNVDGGGVVVSSGPGPSSAVVEDDDPAEGDGSHRRSSYSDTTASSSLSSDDDDEEERHHHHRRHRRHRIHEQSSIRPSSTQQMTMSTKQQQQQQRHRSRHHHRRHSHSRRQSHHRRRRSQRSHRRRRSRRYYETSSSSSSDDDDDEEERSKKASHADEEDILFRKTPYFRFLERSGRFSMAMPMPRAEELVTSYVHPGDLSKSTLHHEGLLKTNALFRMQLDVIRARIQRNNAELLHQVMRNCGVRYSEPILDHDVLKGKLKEMLALQQQRLVDDGVA